MDNIEHSTDQPSSEASYVFATKSTAMFDLD